MDRIDRMTNPDDLPRVMTAKEVAAFCGFDLKTVYEAQKRGELPGGRAGRAYRFSRDDVLQWLKGNVTHS
jgi:excisionase family DNA binding protein